MKAIDDVLNQLAELIQQGRFKELETDVLEIKPVPAQRGDCDSRERHKKINAFLNTKGGILILGSAEEGKRPDDHYVLKGCKHDAEAKLKDLPRLIEDRQ